MRAVPRRLPGLAVGTCAALVLASGLTLPFLLGARPFSAIDENAHTAYAFSVTAGDLPTMRTPVSLALPGMHPGRIYVANHPPLYYLVTGGVLRAGGGLGVPQAGFFAARAVSLVALLVALVLVVLLVRELVPRRPELGLAAAGLLAPLPLLVQAGATIMNDTAALAATVWALLMAVRVVRRGATWRRVGWLTLATTVAGLIRSSGLVLVLIAALAVALAVGNDARDGDHRRALLLALPRVLLSPIAVAATTGWFLLRNQRLYGDTTGSDLALRLFPARHIPVPTMFTQHFWQGIFGNAFGRPQYLHSASGTTVTVLFALITAGLILGAPRAAWLLLRQGPGRVRAVCRPTRRWQPWLLVGLHAGFTVVSFLLYADEGGAIFARYLLPTAVVAALGIAWSLRAWPGGRSGLPTVAFLAVLTGLGLTLTSAGLQWRRPLPAHRSAFGRFTDALAANDIPAPAAVTAVLLTAVIAGFLVLAVSILRLSAPRPAADASKAPGQPRRAVTEGSSHPA